MKKQGTHNTYWGNIREAVSSSLTGLKLSFSHLLQARQSRKPIGVENKDYFQQTTGIVTLQYPKQEIPVPDHGRYQLRNEIDDCIVCDKCAKICPVNCIEIEAVRAVEEIGKTSDGSSKRIYPARFDIDMGKCCFCGLCTTVCPTECLTMTKEYDFSEFDVADHKFAFSEMTPMEILEKQKALDQYMQAKEAEKAKANTTPGKAEDQPKPAAAKPAFEPKVQARPLVPKNKPEAKATGQDESPREMAKKIMRQRKKPVIPVRKKNPPNDSPNQE